jgi:hypothetical protein
MSQWGTETFRDLRAIQPKSVMPPLLTSLEFHSKKNAAPILFEARGIFFLVESHRSVDRGITKGDDPAAWSISMPSAAPDKSMTFSSGR